MIPVLLTSLNVSLMFTNVCSRRLSAVDQWIVLRTVLHEVYRRSRDILSTHLSCLASVEIRLYCSYSWNIVTSEFVPRSGTHDSLKTARSDDTSFTHCSCKLTSQPECRRLRKQRPCCARLRCKNSRWKGRPKTAETCSVCSCNCFVR